MRTGRRRQPGGNAVGVVPYALTVTGREQALGGYRPTKAFGHLVRAAFFQRHHAVRRVSRG